jgi:uncharacterized protein (DUF1697 family)
VTELHQYVALVRALNVGGTSVVKMTTLKKLFEDLGFTGVSAYIQSGNVIFSAVETVRAEIAAKIESALSAANGSRPAKVFILTGAELQAAAANNPFHPENDPDLHCYLVFLSAAPEASRFAALMKLQGEEYRFAISGSVFYYCYPSKFAAARRRSLDFEKVLGVTGTARGWKVVNKLIELIGQ